ncbi:MAG: hypothetical protein K8Q99_00640 [Acholeplasmataceae bacterium]|nr:hypothetical protein [Acholeplasmataceae bacterium]
MKKLVKVALVIVVLVMGLAFGLSVNSSSQRDISLDFENSGQPEWYEIVEIKGSKKGFGNVQGFKNSGLPETIEVKSL